MVMERAVETIAAASTATKQTRTLSHSRPGAALFWRLALISLYEEEGWDDQQERKGE